MLLLILKQNFSKTPKIYCNVNTTLQKCNYAIKGLMAIILNKAYTILNIVIKILINLSSSYNLFFLLYMLLVIITNISKISIGLLNKTESFLISFHNYSSKLRIIVMKP